MWQPIETAPRDGKTFLAYTIDSYGRRIEFAQWRPGLSENSGHFSSQSGAIPTHWMPLPTPPTTEE
jgi:hypothetical protein